MPEPRLPITIELSKSDFVAKLLPTAIRDIYWADTGGLFELLEVNPHSVKVAPWDFDYWIPGGIPD